jgi:sporulation protein YlmC with PRC-barrel domain
MLNKLALAATLAASLAGTAYAQQTTTGVGGPATAQVLNSLPSNSTTVTNYYKQNVYDPSDAKIGEIGDVLVGKDGKIEAFIVSVGGFLGMGEHYVAVGYDKLKWVNEPVRSASTASDRPATAPATSVDSNARTAADGNARTTTGAAVTVRNTNWYPDHVVYNATKDQLKAMPEFKY